MLSVERLYETVALLMDEELQQLQIDRALLPADIKEGDLLTLIDGQYQINDEATAQKRHQNLLRLQRLAAKDRVDQSE